MFPFDVLWKNTESGQRVMFCSLSIAADFFSSLLSVQAVVAKSIASNIFFMYLTVFVNVPYVFLKKNFANCINNVFLL